MTGTFNWVLTQGTDIDFIFTWTASNGLPVDLTGYTAHVQVASGSANDTTRSIYLDLTSGGGTLILGGTAGTIEMVISHALTSALAWIGDAAWDMKLTAPSGKITRLLQGAVTYSPQITS